MIDVVIAGGGPNGLMLAGELGLAGIRPVVLDPMPGPNPGRRANGVIGQGVRILDHRGLYWVPAFSVLTTGGTRRVAELARDGRPLLVDLTEHGVVSAAMPDADEVRCVTHSRGGSASEPLLRVDLVLILLRSRRHRRRQR